MRVVLLLAIALVACGGKTPGGEPTGDSAPASSATPNGSSSSSSPGGVGSSDGPNGSGDPSSSGNDGSADGSYRCTDLAQLAQPVNASVENAPPPTADGGVIAYGLYVRTSATWYGSANPAPLGEIGSRTIRLFERGFDSLTTTSQGGLADDHWYGWVNGTTFAVHRDCPGIRDTTLTYLDYSATSTTFTLIQHIPGSAWSLVETFTKL